MHQDNEPNSQDDEEGLDKRLAAFYGSPLKEQPLSSASWNTVRKQLARQKKRGRQINWKYLFRRRRRVSVPDYVQQAFERICFDARVHSDASLLRCAFRAGFVPSVHLSRYGTRIQLVLPWSVTMEMDMAVLDTLLTIGLARYKIASQLRYRLMYVFPLIAVLLSCLLLLLSWGKSAVFVAIPLIVAVFALWLLLALRLRRNLWLASDAVAARWLGRGRICQGLRRLADYERTPQRAKWGVPSLAERIERVCGTQVEARDDNLTLVR